jgi:hypothetical protein
MKHTTKWGREGGKNEKSVSVGSYHNWCAAESVVHKMLKAWMIFVSLHIFCKTEGYFGWRILHTSGVNNGRMCEKRLFITGTTSSLCTLCEFTLPLMLYFTCNYFRKFNKYTFRRVLLSTPVNFLFCTAVIFSALRKKCITFSLHKLNIMFGMRFPAFTFNLSPLVTH